MARPQADDLLQSFRFRVVAVEDGFINSEAGFNQATIPNITVEVGEYREGNKKYTRKQPGVPTVESVTMQRGIALTETQFAAWILAKLLNGAPYRTDLLVNVYNQENTGENSADAPSRQVRCAECFPTSVKLIGDLDATSSDINLQEIECACEEVHLQIPSLQ